MKKGREMAMMVGIVLLMSIQLYVPSLAQKECWRNIRICLNDVETWDEFQEECCKVVFEEINSEKECFCSVKPTVDRNVSIAGALSKILTVCDIASFDTICSDSDNSSPITPEPPSTTDSIAPQPSPPLGDPTPSSPPEVLFPPTPATDNDTSNESGDENDGNDTSNNGSGEIVGDYTSNNGNGDENDDKDTSKGDGTSIRGGDKNDSNAKKIGYQMVILSSSALFIWAILLS